MAEPAPQIVGVVHPLVGGGGEAEDFSAIGSRTFTEFSGVHD
jgi:hypothetical protein